MEISLQTAKTIADYCQRPELEAALLSEREALWAMHEAEKVLGVMHQESYAVNLGKLVKNTEPCLEWDHFRLIHATAAQCAEAFLRTLNLWKDK